MRPSKANLDPTYRKIRDEAQSILKKIYDDKSHIIACRSQLQKAIAIIKDKCHDQQAFYHSGIEELMRTATRLMKAVIEEHGNLGPTE